MAAGMLKFLTSGAGLAVLGAIGAALLLALAFHKGEVAGKADDLKATTQTQRRIDDADAAGPRTPDDVDERLRRGRF